MKQDILQLISRNYKEILPQNEQTLLLLVWLNHKIERGDIEEEFTIRDFEEAIGEIADFLHEDKSIQKETLSKKISGINEKIQLASKRLRNLLDTLRHKQQFKINLEKFLHILLINGKNIKGEIILPDSFPRKKLPAEFTKYVSIPKIDFQLFNLAEPERTEMDKEYYQRQKDKNLSMLKIQEQTAKWLDRIDAEVKTGNEVRFEEWLDRIIEIENNLEVPIQVCYGLILRTKKNKSQELIIEQEKLLLHKAI